MAERTVREQMAAALDRTADSYHRHWCPDKVTFEDCTYPVCFDNRLALARHRAEPEGCICSECPVCAVSVRDCRCFEEGLEAQREPAGRGTA